MRQWLANVCGTEVLFAPARGAWRCAAWLACLCWVVCLGLGCGRAGPPVQPPLQRGLTACGPKEATPVSIVFDTATARRGLEAAICDWAASAPWRIVFDPAELSPAREARSFRVLIELSLEREAVLRVFSPDGDRWQHEVALPAGMDETGVEAIAQALHSSLEAAALKTSRAEPIPRAEAPAEPIARRPLRLRSGLGYHFYARGDEPTTHGPRLRLEIDWRSEPPVLGSFVVASLFGSARERVNDLAISLRGAAIGAGLTSGLASGPWKGRVALGASVDIMAIEVQVLDPEALRRVGDDRLRPRAFVASEVGFGFRTGPVEFELNGLLRWQLSESHYDIRDGTQIARLLTPWRLQPGVALDAAYLW